MDVRGLDDGLERSAVRREVVYVVNQMVVETDVRIMTRRGAGSGETMVGRSDRISVGNREVRGL